MDTNILVRAFLEDDVVQAQRAQTFLKNNSIFISSYAILEFAWVLKVKKFTRKEIYDAIMILVDSFRQTIGQREAITTVLEKYIWRLYDHYSAIVQEILLLSMRYSFKL